MKRKYFVYESYCELIITSKEITPDDITSELHIKPQMSYKIGETYVSKHSGSIITRRQNYWYIKSKTKRSNRQHINFHITFFRELLKGKKEVIIKKYKKDKRFFVSFWIWIETDNAGIGLDIKPEDLNFISEISNEIHFAFYPNQKL